MLNLLALLLWPGTNGGTPPAPSSLLTISDTRLVPDAGRTFLSADTGRTTLVCDAGRTALVCDAGRTFLTPD